jgi:hypothetical protein
MSVESKIGHWGFEYFLAIHAICKGKQKRLNGSTHYIRTYGSSTSIQSDLNVSFIDKIFNDTVINDIQKILDYLTFKSNVDSKSVISVRNYFKKELSNRILFSYFRSKISIYLKSTHIKTLNINKFLFKSYSKKKFVQLFDFDEIRKMNINKNIDLVEKNFNP